MTHEERATERERRQQRRERRDAFPTAIPKARKRGIGRSTTRKTPLHLRSRHVDVDDALRDYMRARVGFKLGKFALHVTRVTVRVEDDAGPKGAPVYRCRFTVVMPGTHEVVVAATESTVRAAFDASVAEVERAVRRALRK